MAEGMLYKQYLMGMHEKFLNDALKAMKKIARGSGKLQLRNPGSENCHIYYEGKDASGEGWNFNVRVGLKAKDSVEVYAFGSRTSGNFDETKNFYIWQCTPGDLAHIFVKYYQEARSKTSGYTATTKNPHQRTDDRITQSVLRRLSE